MADQKHAKAVNNTLHTPVAMTVGCSALLLIRSLLPSALFLLYQLVMVAPGIVW
jgi:hypothetical protein